MFDGWVAEVARRPRRGGRRRPDVTPLTIRQDAEHKADGGWIVRPMSGASSVKDYRCPGCQQPIPAGTPHLVVWPQLPAGFTAPSRASGVEERRHWHTSCWRRRA